jgi:ribosomal protein L30/L7E
MERFKGRIFVPYGIKQEAEILRLREIGSVTNL